ncbi:VOC family protein [Hyphococcus sp.]|uniref:VOC family protein n=1 Tax=Hyphococcus sp. TaxID=2038636 RepID=UPI0035C67CAB
MRINALDHVNIQTLKLKETVDFYADVLDLDARDPPPPLDPKLVQWMYDAEDRAIFHLTTPGSIMGDGGRRELPQDTGPVHHVALNCSGHDAMVKRLASLGLDHTLNHVTAIDLKQIFVRDPNGVLLELNYFTGNH